MHQGDPGPLAHQSKVAACSKLFISALTHCPTEDEIQCAKALKRGVQSRYLSWSTVTEIAQTSTNLQAKGCILVLTWSKIGEIAADCTKRPSYTS